MSVNQYFEVKRPEPWLYSIRDRMEVFCWLLVGEKAALLLDTGYGIGNLPAKVRELTDKPLTVMLSHAHTDHAMGAYQFDRVLLHPSDFELLSEHCGVIWRRKAVDAVMQNHRKLAQYIKGFDSDGYLQKGAGNPERLEEDAEFDLGGLTAQVVPMPGHTKGSSGLFIPEHEILLTGDAANRSTFMFMPESLPLAEYVVMLKKTAEIGFTAHYVGHQEMSYPKKWFGKYIKVAENALAGNGKPMKIHGLEEYGEILVSSIGGPVMSPAFCAVGYTADKL